MGKIIRVLVAKAGCDIHERGALTMMNAFRDAGMEVIYTGRYQSEASIVRTAIAEDVDIIGITLGFHQFPLPGNGAGVDPINQIVFVFEVVVKGLPPSSRSLYKFGNRDFAQGLFCAQLDQRVGQDAFDVNRHRRAPPSVPNQFYENRPSGELRGITFLNQHYTTFFDVRK